MRIDAHQHYWSLERDDYGWLGPARPTLNQNFLPADLRSELTEVGIVNTILVQAAASCAETEFLLELAKDEPSIAGVVGWINMNEQYAAADLSRFAMNPLFCGVRLMAPAEQDIYWLADPAFAAVLQMIEEANLTLDVLMLPVHLPALMYLAERHPGLRIVINHAAKPDVEQGSRADWLTAMAPLTAASNVACKLSGLTALCGAEEQTTALSPYVNDLLTMFGPDRLLWGSDWPVLNETSSYKKWYDVSEQLLAGLSSDERAAIFGGTAAQVYRLPRRFVI